MMYHIGLLFQAAQNYHWAGLASAMSTGIVTAYEGTNLKNLLEQRNGLILWYKKMVRTPSLAPNREEIAKEV